MDTMPATGRTRSMMRSTFEAMFADVLKAQRGKSAGDALIDVCWNVYLIGLKDGIAKGLTYKMEDAENE